MLRFQPRLVVGRPTTADAERRALSGANAGAESIHQLGAWASWLDNVLRIRSSCCGSRIWAGARDRPCRFSAITENSDLGILGRDFYLFGANGDTIQPALRGFTMYNRRFEKACYATAAGCIENHAKHGPIGTTAAWYSVLHCTTERQG
jgi:hypothetical protein